MKILMVNKFLYPNGGSEAYMFQLGAFLSCQGHEVQYFGMEHQNRCVGNAVNAYTRGMDFHEGPLWSKVTYPLKTIYNFEAARKIRLVLEDFQPDVIHLNNFTYQLTPSIILSVVKWRRTSHRNCRIIFTAHDYNLICPNHLLYNPDTRKICEKCLGGHFLNCVREKCIHGSRIKSAVGTMEALFWNQRNVYRYIDQIICCSTFMKEKMDSNPLFAAKTVTLHNFISMKKESVPEKKDYVLYFGRFSEEKGIRTLLAVCEALPEIPFVFAGTGPLEDLIDKLPNVRNVGFQSGESLKTWIREARLSVYPSEWYENCPLAVMESQQCGTPVVGSNMGGIPELIRPGETGELFDPGDQNDLKEKIRKLYNNMLYIQYVSNCRKIEFPTIKQYYKEILNIYEKGFIDNIDANI